jgi:hypothetical protein
MSMPSCCYDDEVPGDGAGVVQFELSTDHSASDFPVTAKQLRVSYSSGINCGSSSEIALSSAQEVGKDHSNLEDVVVGQASGSCRSPSG